MINQPSMSLLKDFADYCIDFPQRAILFSDVLRKRGNNYLEHLQRGQPPVLVFDYDTILDGRDLAQPVNYALVKIRDRREASSKVGPARKASERRVTTVTKKEHTAKRPIVVIDPRAGHGPGIGGAKLDSQIGVALNFGHPVYFILFFTEPEPGQTLAHVQQAEIRFLEEVARRHPDAEKPAVIGNCQAGWAAALIGADRPDIVGPMVFNGSPLSYWGGIEGANPMRYRGGLVGGAWLTSLWCDLGNGKFDGANLVSGFEDLNPANTLWQKQYRVWANIDTEARRYLDFEKWWGGFFKLNREEIHFIVESLFVGNELESGFLKLGENKIINLKNFRDPIVVFASKGDNITPPQQALNWIVKVYGSVDEIKRHGQVIVYLLHERIGHLGIFVSSSVAGREHKEIISSVETIDYLTPGLYEMVIEAEPSKPWLNDHKVVFVERNMEDILRLDDTLEDESAFLPVAAISRFNDKLYQTFVSPWLRALMNERTAEWFRQLHPLRIQRYGLSDRNPWIWPIRNLTPLVKTLRRPAADDNTFLAMERAMAETVATLLDSYRGIRDASQELLFNMLYANPWIKALFGGLQTIPLGGAESHPIDIMDEELWRAAMREGGFQAAVIRILLAVMSANHRIDRAQYQAAGKIIKHHVKFAGLTPGEIKRISRQQAAFLAKNQDLAIATLADLLGKAEDRSNALQIAMEVAEADDQALDEAEQAMLAHIKAVLLP